MAQKAEKFFPLSTPRPDSSGRGLFLRIPGKADVFAKLLSRNGKRPPLFEGPYPAQPVPISRWDILFWFYKVLRMFYQIMNDKSGSHAVFYQTGGKNSRNP
ncbi:hypothetical protein [uncultured Subdoligranulum sp.]|uniref:hypothetical protein n=1 Tax=uncultured Subdoligranulum sp. TaxID=512298 RepID=UPI002618947B|nr:hypothetical protein [uncultured Subdoligranulum sp.]